MKNSLYLILIFLFSCQTIDFDRYPEKSIDSFEKNLQGKYIMINKGIIKDTSTLIVRENNIDIKTTTQEINMQLDSNSIFSKTSDWYFISLSSNTEEGEIWNLYALKPTHTNNFMIYNVSKNKSEKKLLKYFDYKDKENKIFLMDEDKLVQYCNKNLKKKEASKLIKIN